MLQKMRGDFIQNSPFRHRNIHFLVPKYFPQIMLEKIRGEMLCRIYCFLTKIAHVGIEIFNRKQRILRYKKFPNPTKMLLKKWGSIVQNSLLSYKISACGDRKIQYSIIQHYKIFPTKNVANGGRL